MIFYKPYDKLVNMIKRLSLLIIIIALSACSSVTPPTTPKPTLLTPSPERLKINDYPILPEVNAAMREIYQAGLKRGNNPRVFSKFGDCMTANPYFLGTFSKGKYNLGKYENLKEVIAYFANTPARSENWQEDSFTTASLTANNGFNSAGPLNPMWADPKWCGNNENPLQCELRVAKPSIVIMMFGTNDVQFTEPGNYEKYLRTIIAELLKNDIVPIISTFPTRPEDPAKSLVLNQIVIKIALDNKIPLVNLNRALEPLPNHGVNPKDTLHLTLPDDEVVDNFTEPYLQYGFPLRNLVTLQALEVVWKAVK